MHPLLHLQNLKKLPEDALKIANTVTLFDFFQLTKVDAKLEYLPIYYHVLDPRRIPTPEELEDPNIVTHGNLAATLLCTNPLFRTLVPPDVLPDLWPHLWPWIDFIFTFDDFLTENIKWFFPAPMYFNFIYFCSAMWDHGENKDIIVSNPRCAAIAIRAWAWLLDHDDVLERGRHILIIQSIIHQSGATLDDILDAVEGRLDEIARLVMRQCAPLVPLNQKPITFQMDQEENTWLLEYAVGIVACLDQVTNHSIAASRRLCTALVSFGFVETLTASCYGLSLSSNGLSHAQRRAIHGFLSILIGIFEGPKGSEALQLSVETGLLNVVLQHAQWPPSHVVHEDLVLLMKELLPRSTIYYHTLSKFRPLVPMLEIVDKTPQIFRVDSVYDAWKSFSELCRERLRAQAVFDSKVGPFSRACDNVECGKLLPKNTFKRCAGCSSVLYCSRECQRVDWRSGHRNACIWHLSNRHRIRVIFSAKEYSFLRFLMQLDYCSQKSTFVAHLFRHWASNPNETVASLFDYRSGRIEVTCFGADLDEADDSEICDSEYYKDIEKRVERSAGRMTLDVMRVPYGTGYRDLILPLRRETGRIEADLKRISQAMGSSFKISPQLYDVIESAMREEGQVTR
ncbi:hypothetical protein R3P38DRAFT_2950731 [Favolaschia claudopus]|uniref:MYND-type domain-containing protein n=1 Tax=Favolaschia claudopus TaxID=2862362 RepID=A0AAW0BEV4_9AGAR